MLHAENRLRLLECQDEVTIEPCSKKMKSTEGPYEKLSDVNNQGIHEEVDVERPSNGLIPVCVSDNQENHEMQKQEKISSGVLGTLDEAHHENNLMLSQPVDSETVQNVDLPFVSLNDTEIEGKTDTSLTNNAGEDNTENSSTSFSLYRNASDEEFFTSKEFIGPIYEPAKSDKQDKSGSCNECRSSERDQNELHESRAKRKETKTTQAISALPEIDDELDLFYKEIHQLENENLDTNFQKRESETSQEQYSPYICSQTSQEDYQGVLSGNSQSFYENGQCIFGDQNGQRTNNEQQFVMEASSWKTENTFNGKVDSKYWNYSVPEFRPAWQSESFAVPQGPPSPRSDRQSCFQILNSLPQNTSALHSQNSELSYKSYHGYHGNTDINSHGSLLDQSHIDMHTTQVFINGHNDQNGLQRNGFCETREECWKDPRPDNREGMHNFSSLQLPEERVGCSEKLLLILRGLPGSGKSTLSR